LITQWVVVKVGLQEAIHVVVLVNTLKAKKQERLEKAVIS